MCCKVIVPFSIVFVYYGILHYDISVMWQVLFGQPATSVGSKS